jgi:thimet oligopeptidase
LQFQTLDPLHATRYYVQRQLLEFRLAGVDKDDATRAKLTKLQSELNDAQSKFGRNVADATESIAVAGVSELENIAIRANAQSLPLRPG